MSCLAEYGVTCSYDEIRKFKISAASQASKKKTLLLENDGGLIQGVSDNFDVNLFTQNGLQQTHSLATIFLQHRLHPSNNKRHPIPRLKHSELSEAELICLKYN